jgi:hypothetical protein
MEAAIEKFIENHCQKTPPVECGFKVGDVVTFTNEYGVKFENLVIFGFAKDDSFYGRFIHLFKDSYWFPVRPSELKLQQKPEKK